MLPSSCLNAGQPAGVIGHYATAGNTLLPLLSAGGCDPPHGRGGHALHRRGAHSWLAADLLAPLVLAC